MRLRNISMVWIRVRKIARLRNVRYLMGLFGLRENGVVKKLSKDSFLDLLNKPKEKVEEKTWEVLDDDFMMGAKKMKDFDQSEEEPSEQDLVVMSSEDED